MTHFFYIFFSVESKSFCFFQRFREFLVRNNPNFLVYKDFFYFIQNQITWHESCYILNVSISLQILNI